MDRRFAPGRRNGGSGDSVVGPPLRGRPSARPSAADIASPSPDRQSGQGSDTTWEPTRMSSTPRSTYIRDLQDNPILRGATGVRQRVQHFAIAIIGACWRLTDHDNNPTLRHVKADEWAEHAAENAGGAVAGEYLRKISLDHMREWSCRRKTPRTTTNLRHERKALTGRYG